MKNSILALSALLVLVLMSGCSSKGATETGSTTEYYSSSKNVTPLFVEDIEASINKDLELDESAWGGDNPMYQVYYLFQDFDPTTDNGVIDTSNFYKTIYEANNFVNNVASQCSTIAVQAITPPFDFGNPEVTYDCALNEEADSGYDFSGAIKLLDVDGNIIAKGTEGAEAVQSFTLAGFVWVDSINPHNEYGSFQGNLDVSTDLMSVDLAVWVDYEGENDYCYRNDIQGNRETHEFALRSMKGSLVEGNSWISIVGKGISQGEGNYFLLKISNNDITEKYFCIPATAGEDELKLIDPEGSDTVDSNCEKYQADVDAMTMLTIDDLLCSSEQLNPGTPKEGTIFINFE